ncbi:hypothetical protein A8B73_01320 [Methylosinus sp. 3S-1]|nr:hypothetical protein A8B73_01320 [Methylosinus sp. 3S-1]
MKDRPRRLRLRRRLFFGRFAVRRRSGKTIVTTAHPGREWTSGGKIAIFQMLARSWSLAESRRSPVSLAISSTKR